MSNNNGSTVPIVVPELSSRSEADPYGYDGEVIHQPDYTVVVPVASDLFDDDTGINARRFLQTAIALADDNDGHVVLLGIAEVADKTTIGQVREYVQSGDGGEKERSVPEVVTERRTQLAQIVDVVGDIDRDVPVRASVRVVTDTTRGILEPGSSKEKDGRLAATVESREDSPRRVGHDPHRRPHRYVTVNVPDDVNYLRQLSPSLGNDVGN